jgi:hypothetical protein
MQSAVISRLKIMGQLDIAERRLPQDGRASIRMGGRSMDLRVAILPTTHGEKVTIRIAGVSEAALSLAQLGMTPTTEAQFMKAISEPFGTILSCGPTGSGKTSTLYAALELLNDAERSAARTEARRPGSMRSVLAKVGTGGAVAGVAVGAVGILGAVAAGAMVSSVAGPLLENAANLGVDFDALASGVDVEGLASSVGELGTGALDEAAAGVGELGGGAVDEAAAGVGDLAGSADGALSGLGDQVSGAGQSLSDLAEGFDPRNFL